MTSTRCAKDRRCFGSNRAICAAAKIQSDFSDAFEQNIKQHLWKGDFHITTLSSLDKAYDKKCRKYDFQKFWGKDEIPKSQEGATDMLRFFFSMVYAGCLPCCCCDLIDNGQKLVDADVEYVVCEKNMNVVCGRIRDSAVHIVPLRGCEIEKILIDDTFSWRRRCSCRWVWPSTVQLFFWFFATSRIFVTFVGLASLFSGRW